jgi:hypothetical protein
MFSLLVALILMVALDGRISAIDDDLTLLMHLQPVDAADQRGFPRTRRAADDNPLASIDSTVDIMQHLEAAIPFRHAPDVDGGGDLFVCSLGVLGHFWLPLCCVLTAIMGEGA